MQQFDLLRTFAERKNQAKTTSLLQTNFGGFYPIS